MLLDVHVALPLQTTHRAICCLQTVCLPGRFALASKKKRRIDQTPGLHRAGATIPPFQTPHEASKTPRTGSRIAFTHVQPPWAKSDKTS